MNNFHQNLNNISRLEEKNLNLGGVMDQTFELGGAKSKKSQGGAYTAAHLARGGAPPTPLCPNGAPVKIRAEGSGTRRFTQILEFFPFLFSSGSECWARFLEVGR